MKHEPPSNRPFIWLSIWAALICGAAIGHTATDAMALGDRQNAYVNGYSAGVHDANNAADAREDRKLMVLRDKGLCGYAMLACTAPRKGRAP